MKKFLLGTTALISMSAASAALAGGSHAPAAATPANTGGLTVMVGGNINVQSVFRQEDGEVIGDNARNGIIRNDTHLNFTAAGSTDDFDYGAVIELAADNGSDKNSEVGGTKTYLYVENDAAGRFEAGQNVGASDTLEVDASRIARGTGGVDGDWVYNLIGTTGTYITTPNLPTGNEDTDAGNANKITYYTPRFSGLQFGVSYTPDTGNRGSASTITTDAGTNYSNVFAGGLNFESDIADGVGIMASAVGEFGEGESGTGTLVTTDDVNDLNAYSLGLGVEFEGFSVAGNWADLGDSGLDSTPVAAASDNQSYWTLGAAYENGPYGVSVTYLESTQSNALAASATQTGENELSNLVVGADYQMAPGLVPYVEASFFDFENGSSTATDDNSGNVVIVGANLAF